LAAAPIAPISSSSTACAVTVQSRIVSGEAPASGASSGFTKKG